MPCASMATSVTSARPIISAAAVEAVRCGFRFAFSRARPRDAVGAERRETRQATRAGPAELRDEPHDEHEERAAGGTASAAIPSRNAPIRFGGRARSATRRSGAASTDGGRGRIETGADGDRPCRPDSRRLRAGDDPRGEERDAEEDQQRADAHEEQDLRRAEAAAEERRRASAAKPSAGQDRDARACGSARSATPAASRLRGRRRSAARASRGWRGGGSRAA